MDPDLLIKSLLKTPAPTGLALGQALDAWADWCASFKLKERVEEVNRIKAKVFEL